MMLDLKNNKGEEIMKRLVCEMCGSTDLIKEDGVFVCQTCGCKYSVEEAKKMMVEGVVEVTGTVKVDNSENIEKLIINADRAYDDGRYKEAEKIYSSVLEIDTENVWAIHRKGMSISYQGNIADGSIGIGGKTAIRAIDCLYEGEKEYEQEDRIEILADIISETWDLSEKIVLYALNEMRYALQNYADTINELSSKMHSLPYDYLRERQEYACKEKDRSIESAKDIKILGISMILAVFMDVIMKMELENEENAMLIYALLEVKMKQNAETYSETLPDMFDRYSEMLKEGKNRIKQAEETRRRKATEEYWAAHPEEKKALDEEDMALQDELEKLQSEENDIMIEIAEWNAKKEEVVPAEEERNVVQEEINKLTAERKKLGLFKKKEKEIIDERVNVLKRKYEEVQNSIISQRSERDVEYDKEITELAEKTTSIKNRINEITLRRKRINLELTKGRCEA